MKNISFTTYPRYDKHMSLYIKKEGKATRGKEVDKEVGILGPQPSQVVHICNPGRRSVLGWPESILELRWVTE